MIKKIIKNYLNRKINNTIYNKLTLILNYYNSFCLKFRNFKNYNLYFKLYKVKIKIK